MNVKKHILIVSMLLIGLFMTNCASLNQISIEYEKDLGSVSWPSHELEKKFLHYWTLRSNKDYASSFKMEAPYLQEIVPMPIYEMAIGKKTTIEKIKILRFQMETSAFYSIAILLEVHSEKQQIKKVFLNDLWVKTNETWYHVIKDPIMKKIFP
ncbi:MAG: hypothetical protein HQK77_00425 [Desulfobacterales bacterium]|nr:hypothetical protein [Desulfobacterales bacterium]